MCTVYEYYRNRKEKTSSSYIRKLLEKLKCVMYSLYHLEPIIPIDIIPINVLLLVENLSTGKNNNNNNKHHYVKSIK